MELNVCRYLYDRIKDGPLASTFGFVHPTAISLAGGSTSKQRIKSRAKCLADCLMKCGAKQFIFIPYNPR